MTEAKFQDKDPRALVPLKLSPELHEKLKNFSLDPNDVKEVVLGTSGLRATYIFGGFDKILVSERVPASAVMLHKRTRRLTLIVNPLFVKTALLAKVCKRKHRKDHTKARSQDFMQKNRDLLEDEDNEKLQEVIADIVTHEFSHVWFHHLERGSKHSKFMVDLVHGALLTYHMQLDLNLTMFFPMKSDKLFHAAIMFPRWAYAVVSRYRPDWEDFYNSVVGITYEPKMDDDYYVAHRCFQTLREHSTLPPKPLCRKFFRYVEAVRDYKEGIDKLIERLLEMFPDMDEEEEQFTFFSPPPKKKENQDSQDDGEDQQPDNSAGHEDAPDGQDGSSGTGAQGGQPPGPVQDDELSDLCDPRDVQGDREEGEEEEGGGEGPDEEEPSGLDDGDDEQPGADDQEGEEGEGDGDEEGDSEEDPEDGEGADEDEDEDEGEEPPEEDPEYEVPEEEPEEEVDDGEPEQIDPRTEELDLNGETYMPLGSGSIPPDFDEQVADIMKAAGASGNFVHAMMGDIDEAKLRQETVKAVLKVQHKSLIQYAKQAMDLSLKPSPASTTIVPNRHPIFSDLVLNNSLCLGRPPRYRPIHAREDDIRRKKVRLYIDVSGSMTEAWEDIVAFSIGLNKHCDLEVFQFSTDIKELTIAELRQGVIKTWGGTNVTPIVNDIVKASSFCEAFTIMGDRFYGGLDHVPRVAQPITILDIAYNTDQSEAHFRPTEKCAVHYVNLNRDFTLIEEGVVER